MENAVTLPPNGSDGNLMATDITVASAIAMAEKTSCFVVIFLDIKKTSLHALEEEHFSVNAEGMYVFCIYK